jgi:hypothetical protein
MQGLETFPPWAQITLSVIGFIIAAAAYFRGLFKTAPPPSKDVVIPSLTVADNAVIADAAATLKEANHHLRDRNHLDREMLFHMKMQTEHLEDIKHALAGMAETDRKRRSEEERKRRDQERPGPS